MSDDQLQKRIGRALGKIPSGLFILTARYEEHSGGLVTSWVQQTCFDPPMVSVAVAKGHPLMPLISDSREFGLCQLQQGEKVAVRKFTGGTDPEDDPFLGFEMVRDTVLDAPILKNVLGYLECELTCHMDVEGDHDLFIGLVRGGNLFNQGQPWVHIRDDGFHY